MKDSAIAHLKSVAPNLLRGEVSKPTPIVEQRAIAILTILQDYQLHTTTEIAEQLGIGKQYVGAILRACQNAWGLMSSTGPNGGWKMLKDNEPIII